MNKLVKLIGIILTLLAFYVFFIGLKQVFSREKVYCEYNRSVYHCTPYCEAIPDVGVFDREYMEETNKVVGTKEMSSQDAYYDLELFMCDYCYSPLERIKREQYLQKIRESKDKKTE